MDLTPAHFSVAPAASTPGTVDGLQPSAPGSLPILVPWGQIVGNILNQTDLVAALAAKADTAALNAHTTNISNPHQVTKAQVGLSNVDNTSDMNKPVSTAQAAAIAGVSIPSGQITDASVLGKQLLTNTTAAQDRTALGSGATGDALFQAATPAAARTTLGGSSIGQSIFTAADRAAVLALVQQSNQPTYRNFFVNGAMHISQEYAGTATSATTGVYPADQWQLLNVTSRLSAQQILTSNFPGFTTALRATVISAGAPAAGDYHGFNQPIEALNFQRVAFGTAGAMSLYLSGYFRSSVAGTFCASLANSALTRAYPVQLTINQPNTTEYKSWLIPGDTAGTWLQGIGVIGAQLRIGLAAGSSFQVATPNQWYGSNAAGLTGQTQLTTTNGATFEMTGLQLEPLFLSDHEHLPFELHLYRARRFWQTSYAYGSVPGTTGSFADAWRGLAINGNDLVMLNSGFPVSMCKTPNSVVYSTVNGALSNIRRVNTGANVGLTAGAGSGPNGIYSMQAAGGLAAGELYDFQYVANARLV